MSRAHATWSASASGRNIACPGALREAQKIPERRTSEAAAWGTVSHGIAEECLTSTKDAADFIGEVRGADGFTFTVDEEMADCTQVFVDYVREHAEGCELLVEQRFDLAAVGGPFDAGGMADAVIFNAGIRNLRVPDLKTGRGVVVSPVGNPQAYSYALGALLANPQWDVDTVTVAIIQPRGGGEPIKEHTITKDHLLGWSVELLEAMLAAAKPDAPLIPGDHCSDYFCPARATCPALRDKALSQAKKHFSFDEAEGVLKPNSSDNLMPEDIEAILDNAGMLQDWLNAVREYARGQLEAGVHIPNYQLVERIGHRKWRNEEGARLVLTSAGLDDSAICVEPKLKSPAQMEKVLGAKRKHLLDNMTEKPVTGVNLVRVDKTSRPAITPAVLQYFGEIGD